jgi:hypothetical protein
MGQSFESSRFLAETRVAYIDLDSRSAALTYWLEKVTEDPEAQALCRLAKSPVPTPSTSSFPFPTLDLERTISS